MFVPRKTQRALRAYVQALCFVQLPNLRRNKGSGLGKLGNGNYAKPEPSETSGGGKRPWLSVVYLRGNAAKEGLFPGIARRQLGSELSGPRYPTVVHIRAKCFVRRRKRMEQKEALPTRAAVALPVFAARAPPCRSS
jgi:hypothetical protein